MSLVLVSRAEGVATLTLNNPAERNTLTAAMVDEIVAAMDEIEADSSVGAIVVTGAAPAFCAGANLGNLAEADETSLGAIYEGFLRIARSPLADAGRGQRCSGRRRHEPGARLRCSTCRPPRQVRHPFPADRPAPRRRPHVDAAPHRRPQVAMAAVVFGEVMDGEEAARVGLAHRCVDDDQLLDAAQAMAARAASAPRELVIEAKKTIQAMADVDTHPDAVKRELDPQLWSTRQPWFAERLAALQAKISTKP